MIEPKRIGLDFDGVIVDHSANKMKLTETLGYHLENWQTNTNVMKRFLQLDAYEELQWHLYSECMSTAPPVAEALESVARLVAAGFEPYIISTRAERTAPFALEWMEKHRVLEMIPRERVFVGHSKEKRALVERFGISAFLDDKITVLASLPATTRRCLFDQHDIAGKIDLAGADTVVRAWGEFVDLLS